MAESTSLASPFRRLSWPNVGLIVLALFTLVAVVGYGTFALNPRLLAGYPSLARFYGISYAFFAQVHVWLTGLVLVLYLWPRVGRRWMGVFVGAYIISLGSELLGTAYGVPFGAYAYTDLLGPKWMGDVPVVIPLSWFSMALPAYGLAVYRFEGGRHRAVRIAYATALLVAWDLSLDPAMSYLTSYWQWGVSGVYYGMPLVNLLGWSLTGALIMGFCDVMDAASWIRRLSASWLRRYYLVVLAMPIGMLVVAGVWGSVLVTAGTVAGLLWISRSGQLTRPVDPTANGHAPAVEEAASRRSPEVPEAFFRHHSKSFSFAAAWFSRDEHELITCLYAFCRTTDDIVDTYEGDPLRAEKRLDDWLERARTAFHGDATDIPWLDRIMSASAEAGLPFSVVEDLADGVRMDLVNVAFETDGELDDYSYRVASVVGIWMCYLFTDPDEEMLARAAAMGRAMQITNIIRDVGEDLAEDRVYIPRTMMRRHGIDRSNLEAMAHGAPVASGYESLLEELMHRADAAYAYAFRGLPRLPPRFRRAAAVAAEVYRGIHQEVRRNGFDNINRRAYTGRFRKLSCSLGGLVRLARVYFDRLRRQWRSRESAGPAAARYLSRLGFVFMLVAVTAPAAVVPAAAHEISAPDVRSSTPPGDHLHVSQREDCRRDRVLSNVREAYVRAVEEETAISSGHRMIEESPCTDPVFEAYDAALTVLKAKHVFWPPTKMKYLDRGLPVLDSLVARHSKHVEVRYLRLLSCYFLPGFLGREWSVEEDFDALIRLLPQVEDRFPTHLYREMLAFVLEKGSPSPKEENDLKAALDDLPAPGVRESSS